MHSYLWLTLVLLCSWISIRGSEGEEWDYHEYGPDVWPDLFPQCAGSAQSPINIKTTQTSYRRFSPIKLSSSYGSTQTFKLINNGHSIAASLAAGAPSQLSFTGGGLQGTYQFVNFHLHWGENYRSSSEHQVNGKKYTAELHVVHQNTATQQLAVLGILIQTHQHNASETPSSADKLWKEYFATASELTEVNDTATIELDLGALIKGHLGHFWRYQGSLTTPPCTEGVVWSVFTTPIDFEDDYIQSLRTNVLNTNFRVLQPRNGRVVYRNFLRATSP